jgi:hypothetical protein
MAIGGEHRPQWVMPRHWQQLCDAARLNFTLLRHRSSALVKALQHELPAVAQALQLKDNAPLVEHIRRIVTKRHGYLQRLESD